MHAWMHPSWNHSFNNRWSTLCPSLSVAGIVQETQDMWPETLHLYVGTLADTKPLRKTGGSSTAASPQDCPPLISQEDNMSFGNNQILREDLIIPFQRSFSQSASVSKRALKKKNRPLLIVLLFHN